MWSDRRLTELFGIDHPIVQAPMAGADSPALAAAVSGAGGLGSLGCAFLSLRQIEQAVADIRSRTGRPFNLNFFCHTAPRADTTREAAWLERLAPFYEEMSIDPPKSLIAPPPFDEERCALVERLRPAVVSFHFGLPEAEFLDRVRKTGASILSSATTPEEARWLAARGVDAIVAQGAEAGGHRGVFLRDWRSGSGMIGLFSLLPQIVDAVDVPVIAAGGIADGRGLAAAITLGASGGQIGTAFLFTPEAGISDAHRKALLSDRSAETLVTNVMSGRPARGLPNRMTRELGALANDLPDFPLPNAAVAPLRTAKRGAPAQFNALWAGQSVASCREMPASQLIASLAAETWDRLCD